MHGCVCAALGRTLCCSSTASQRHRGTLGVYVKMLWGQAGEPGRAARAVRRILMVHSGREGCFRPTLRSISFTLASLSFCSCRRKSGWLQVQAQNEGISVVTENLSWSLLCQLLWSLDRARAREKLKEQSEIALEDCLCSMLIEFTKDKAVCHVLRCGCLGR